MRTLAIRMFVVAIAWSTALVVVAAETPTDEASARQAAGAELRATELAFADSVARHDRAAFASFIAEDAVFVDGMSPTQGRDAIVAEWAGYFVEGGPALEWQPELVELSADGTVGLTRGPWTLRGRSVSGQAVQSHGIFNSVWRRQADGSWKIAFDAGCGPCPKCGS